MWKERVANTKRAIANTAERTKTAIDNAKLKEKTQSVMANIKEKSVDAKNAVVEKSRDLKTSASQKYLNFKEGRDEDSSYSPSMPAPSAPPNILSQSMNGATNIEATRVFGVSVEVACERSAYSHPLMPDVVFKCLAYLTEKGTREEGIFRLSGSTNAIQQMKSSFDQGINVDLNEIYDPHAISGLLKLYLRELPESIVPGNVCSGPEKMNDLKQKIADMQPVPRCILASLMRLLHEVVKNDSVTKMTVNNLLIIFVPTLSCSSDVIHLMLSQTHTVFDVEPLVSYSQLRNSWSGSTSSEGDPASFDDTYTDATGAEGVETENGYAE